MYGCVCFSMSACLRVAVFSCGYVCRSEALCRLVGVNGWDLSTQPLSGTHNRSNETVKAVGSPLTILCSCHIPFVHAASRCFKAVVKLK